MAQVDHEYNIAIVLVKDDLEKIFKTFVEEQIEDSWIRICIEDEYGSEAEMTIYLQGPNGEEKQII
jgi:hypothetical protein